jgi:hypothetical protein
MATKNNHAYKFEKGAVQIDLDWLHQKAVETENCPWCKTKLSYVTGRGQRFHDSATLDRLDNEKFMTHQNVEIVCWRCNAAKGTDSLEGYLTWLRQDRRIS